MKTLLSTILILVLTTSAFAVGTRKIDTSATATGIPSKAIISLNSGSGGAVDAFAIYSLQVKGTGGVPTAWNVEVQGSLDCNAQGVGTYATIIANESTTQSDGDVVSLVNTLAVCVRVNVISLTLGPASAIEITAVLQDQT